MSIMWFILFAGILLIHNAEEWIFVDRLTFSSPGRRIRLPVTRFRVALVLVTLAGMALVPLKASGLEQADRLLAGAAAVMVFNAVFPHLFLTLVLRRYTAGVVTATLLMLPGCFAIIAAAHEAGLHPVEIGIGALLVGLPVLLLLVLLIGPRLWREGPPAKG